MPDSLPAIKLEMPSEIAGAHDGKDSKVGRDVPGPPQEVCPVSPEVCPYLSARDGNVFVMHTKRGIQLTS